MNDARTRWLMPGHFWLALMVCLTVSISYAGDWRQYNGNNGNRTSDESFGSIDWSGGAPTPIWTIPTTNGFSSFTITGGKVFTLMTRLDGSSVKREYCVAFNASNGAEIWAKSMTTASYDGGGDVGDGPRSTPTCDGQRVYAYDSRMNLYCFDAANGTQLWKKNIASEYAGRQISWQSAASPLLEGELIIVPGGGAGQSMLAFNRQDGTLVWSSLDERMTHATPVAATIQGLRQVVFFTQSGLVGVSVADGSRLWSYSFPYNTSTAASPVVNGDYVFCAAGYGVGAGYCHVTKNGTQLSATQVWRKSSLQIHWSTPVCKDGYLYGLFGSGSYGTAPLKCIDLADGSEKWSHAGFGQGSLILAGNNLVVLADDGQMAIVEATSTIYHEITRARIFNDKCWSSPALSNNRIYARSITEGVCFDLSGIAKASFAHYEY